jgi:hypothetical protein
MVVFLAIWTLYVGIFRYFPPVGTYVVALGVLAVVVTIWPPEGRWSKAAWLLVFLSIAAFEVHNLYRDRDDHDTKEAAARKDEQAAFKTNADSLKAAIQANQQHFDATMEGMGSVIGKENKLANTTTENLARMTGGNSYVYLEPGPAWVLPTGIEYDLVPTFVGRYPLNNVHISVVGRDGTEFNNDYGTMGPIELEIGRPLPLPTLRMKNNRDWEFYTVNINASNGTVSEVIKCHRVGTTWFVAMRAWRVHVPPPKEILKTYVQPGFPTDAKGEVDWDSYK